MKAKILIAEDDRSMISFLQPMLQQAGFQVVVAHDGDEALELTALEQPDLVVLDVEMPERDGWEVCRALRQREHYIPIIMFTVHGEIMEKLYGLDIGADHYFTKTVDPHELIAQIRATLRTVRAIQPPNPMVFDDLVIDPDRWKVSLAGQKIELTRTEFKLLHFLAENPGRVFGRETLLYEIWGWNNQGVGDDSRVVDRHISELRRKLELNPNEPKFILTVRGVGYKFWER